MFIDPRQSLCSPFLPLNKTRSIFCKKIGCKNWIDIMTFLRFSVELHKRLLLKVYISMISCYINAFIKNVDFFGTFHWLFSFLCFLCLMTYIHIWIYYGCYVLMEVRVFDRKRMVILYYMVSLYWLRTYKVMYET